MKKDFFRPLKIVFASSEVFPYAKTGGLADVVGSLPKAIANLGHEVKIITPFYKQTKKSSFDLQKFSKKIYVQLGDRIVDGEIATTKLNDFIDVFFIVKDSYYDRDELYRDSQGDYKDNAERFIFFSKAILSTLEEFDLQADIIHCHDWQTGLTSTLLKTNEANNPFFRKTRTVFTIHNLAFQGLFWHYDMHMTNLPWDVFNPEGIEFYGKINLLKAGIVYSDILTTVSQKYSDEIKTPEFGCGLEGILTKRSEDLYGILNGVDYEDWDPAKDKFIKTNYTPENLSGKLECKKDLLKEFNLTLNPSQPLIGIISRLTDQKGFDLVSEIILQVISKNAGLIVLGTGEEKYQIFFNDLRKKYPDKVGVRIGFDNSIAHKIEAGCDFFLMSSKFEPCGLNQIYSLKYGTIPIVRAVGGLEDTIENFNLQTRQGNGFKFHEYSSQQLLSKTLEALEIYKNPVLFKELIKNGMRCDFSWDSSAKKYEEIYFKALRK
jgi:starch synthase